MAGSTSYPGCPRTVHREGIPAFLLFKFFCPLRAPFLIPDVSDPEAREVTRPRFAPVTRPRLALVPVPNVCRQAVQGGLVPFSDRKEPFHGLLLVSSLRAEPPGRERPSLLSGGPGGP